MKKLWGALVIVILVIAISAVLLSRSRSSPASFSPELLDNVVQLLSREPHHGEGGNVTVQMIFTSPPFFKAQAIAEAQSTGKDPDFLFATYQEQYQLDKYLVFSVSLNTHSVNLSAYDMKSIAFLRDDKGNITPASAWEEDSGSSSHHRSGMFFFLIENASGNLSIDSGAKFMEVDLKWIAGVEEKGFRWDLPISYPSGL